MGDLEGWDLADLLNAFFSESRTSLSNIAGLAELLLRNAAGPLAEPQTEIVQKMQANATRLLTIRQELFEHAKKLLDETQ